MQLKNKKISILRTGLLLTAFILPGTVSAEDASDSYICVPEKSTGFRLNNGQWKQANFSVSGQHFVIRKAKKDDKYELGAINKKFTYTVVEPGLKGAPYLCNIHYNTLMRCEHVLSSGAIRFSIPTGRFVKTQTSGYIAGDNDLDTPFIEIGKCTAL